MVDVDVDVTVEIDARRKPMPSFDCVVQGNQGLWIPPCFRIGTGAVPNMDPEDALILGVRPRRDDWSVHPEQKILLVMLPVVFKRGANEDITIATAANHQSVRIAIDPLRLCEYFLSNLRESSSMPIGGSVVAERAMPRTQGMQSSFTPVVCCQHRLVFFSIYNLSFYNWQLESTVVPLLGHSSK